MSYLVKVEHWSESAVVTVFKVKQYRGFHCCEGNPCVSSIGYYVPIVSNICNPFL